MFTVDVTLQTFLTVHLHTDKINENKINFLTIGSFKIPLIFFYLFFFFFKLM